MKREKVLPFEYGSVTSMPYRKIMTDRPTDRRRRTSLLTNTNKQPAADQPNNQSTDGFRERERELHFQVPVRENRYDYIFIYIMEILNLSKERLAINVYVS